MAKPPDRNPGGIPTRGHVTPLPPAYDAPSGFFSEPNPDPTRCPYCHQPYDKPPFKPKTKLGQRLQELRQKIVASGQRLLSWDEIHEETRKRRAG